MIQEQTPLDLGIEHRGLADLELEIANLDEEIAMLSGIRKAKKEELRVVQSNQLIDLGINGEFKFNELVLVDQQGWQPPRAYEDGYWYSTSYHWGVRTPNGTLVYLDGDRKKEWMAKKELFKDFESLEKD